ncbi:hypothetical protein MNV49_002937 [Pseudohyphozyma bogoriensis]|nr:hypothetical protein MNV49_002937 [Pseudohyphozyma bogoriensis]
MATQFWIFEHYILPRGTDDPTVLGLGSAKNGIMLSQTIHTSQESGALILLPLPLETDPALAPHPNSTPTQFALIRARSTLYIPTVSELPPTFDFLQNPPHEEFSWKPKHDRIVQLPPYWLCIYVFVTGMVAQYGEPEFRDHARQQQYQLFAEYDERSEAAETMGSADPEAEKGRGVQTCATYLQAAYQLPAMPTFFSIRHGGTTERVLHFHPNSKSVSSDAPTFSDTKMLYLFGKHLCGGHDGQLVKLENGVEQVVGLGDKWTVGRSGQRGGAVFTEYVYVVPDSVELVRVYIQVFDNYIVPRAIGDDEDSTVTSLGSARNGIKLSHVLHRFQETGELLLLPQLPLETDPGRAPAPNSTPTSFAIIRHLRTRTISSISDLPSTFDFVNNPPHPQFAWKPEYDEQVQLPPYWLLMYTFVCGMVAQYGVEGFREKVRRRQDDIFRSFDDRADDAVTTGSADTEAGKGDRSEGDGDRTDGGSGRPGGAGEGGARPPAHDDDDPRTPQSPLPDAVSPALALLPKLTKYHTIA